MSFQIPSHNNSINERRERRASNKANVIAMHEVKSEKINRVADALVALECVTKAQNGFKVTMPRIGKYEMSFMVENGKCECGETSCEHGLAAEKFAAKEVAKTEEFLEICAAYTALHPALRSVALNISAEENERWDREFDAMLGIESEHYGSDELDMHCANNGYWEGA